MDIKIVLLCFIVLGESTANGRVGCLFSSELCYYETQVCYDDFAFGQCVSRTSSMDDDFYRYDLGFENLALLEKEMVRLYGRDYRWGHPYTQCVVKAVLGAVRFNVAYLRDICEPWKNLDPGEMMPEQFSYPPAEVRIPEQFGYPAQRVTEHFGYQSDMGVPEEIYPSRIQPEPLGYPSGIETDQIAYSSQMEPQLSGYPSQVEQIGPVVVAEDLEMDPSDVAYVKFRPSDGDPHPEFADEIYYPPIIPEEQPDENNNVNLEENRMVDYNYLTKKSLSQGLPRRSPLMSHLLPPSGIFSPLYNTPDKFRSGLEVKDNNQLVKQQEMIQYNKPFLSREGIENIDQLEQELLQEPSVPQEQNFRQEYNTPDKFREGQETRDEGQEFMNPEEQQELAMEQVFKSSQANEIPQARPGATEELGAGRAGPIMKPGQRLSPKLGRLAGLLYASPDGGLRGAGYTEGGLVRLPEPEEQDVLSAGGDSKVRREGDMGQDIDDSLDALLLGFKRPERLDVKKPGPLFTELNLAEQHKQAEGVTDGAKVRSASGDQLESPHGAQGDAEAGNPQNLVAEKKVLDPPGLGSNPTDSGQYDVVDTNYAYIGFKNSVKSWQQGKRIVRVVAHLLGLPSSALSQERVDRNEVTFKVLPNARGMNASEVAKRIQGIKEDLQAQTGVEVTSAGIGDKTKLPTVLSVEPPMENELYAAALILSSIAISIVLAGLALFFVRRHAKSREKVQGLAPPSAEASKDYQDLCRARMATKVSQEKPEPIGNRIASLSRESEGSNNSPSSRSSTSSWSEEPALTNMDISTGHMVLSYMEDHLKNKDRLEQEWVALCAYEAEPCATIHALKPDNLKKNRYNNVLPYDHSRVVLNDLANISGSDYINASTITDHDPRNPAYIATQGPLPHTAADFWQLIWEQGSVVMVMLTRLTENGTAMCHRYWPEEGSELYHIYEVHLVSEHIWCDDYLVRSFYLKNLKTGETRTVTQFHFLSWPDNGIPHSTKALLEFRRKVNKSYRGRSCPIAVHCSDGVGRAGTYCVIDMVLNRMSKGAKEIDIAATLEHIRDQRANMVKTKQQFEFVLTAVAEEVNAILKALPTQPPAQPATPVITAPQ